MGWYKGYKMSEDQRIAISEGRRGMIFSDQHRANIATARRGTHLTVETRRKLSLIGKKLGQDPSWRAKCLAPNGARTRYGRGGQHAPTMLVFAAVLCPIGYLMDEVTIPIPTGSAYKLDFAHLEAKVDIEIDGKSHHRRFEQDQKRDEYLRSLGWKVIRIKT